MRRRRGNRATWFPILPTIYSETQPGVTWFETTVTFTNTQVAGDTSIVAYPLVLDATPPGDKGTADNYTLRDFVEGQDYLLQRVVGKVWMTILPDDDSTIREAVGCIAMAVLPAEPIGDDAERPALPAEEWNPLFSRNAQQPWIWRRTWRLDNRSIWSDSETLQDLKPLCGFPGSTWPYGSVLDGGHVDARTKRRVTKEHRLFIIAAAGLVSTNPGGPTTNSIFWGYDLRALGTMRRGKNKSSF